MQTFRFRVGRTSRREAVLALAIGILVPLAALTAALPPSMAPAMQIIDARAAAMARDRLSG